jgi:hypothetical protein
MVWAGFDVTVEFGSDNGVGTAIRIPLLGRLVTELLLLYVMNSCDSARMNLLHPPPVRHTDRPVATIRTVMNAFAGICGGTKLFKNPETVGTTCKG